MEEDSVLFGNIEVTKLIKISLFILVWSYVIIYLWIVFQRIQYPFELEWIEGGMVDQVQRILHGQGIYVPPSIEFVPFLYPPFYFYLSAVASAIFGNGFFPLRLISFGASIVALVTIAGIIYGETKNLWAAFLSAGLFIATFRATGAWLDIGRVDSLFLTLWMLFIYVVRGKKNIYVAVLSGLLFSLALLTKQTALVMCLPIIGYLFWLNWKFSLCLLIVATLVFGITTLILNQESSGWYIYYVFTLLSQQTEWLPSKFITFWSRDVVAQLPLAILFAAFVFVKKPKQNGLNPVLWLVILIGALAGAFLTRAKLGGYENVLLPAYAAIVLLFGLGFNEFQKVIVPLPDNYKVLAERLAYLACILQFVLLLYNPFSQIPKASDLNAGKELIQSLSEIEGDVYLPSHGYLPTLAGKKSFAHHSAVWDVLRGGQQTQGKGLLAEDLNRAIHNQYFDVIILDSDWNYCCREIDKYYTREGRVFEDNTVFYPVTGWEIRPSTIYVAKRLK